MRGRINFDDIVSGSIIFIFFVIVAVLALPPLVIVAAFFGYKRTVAMEVSSVRRKILRGLAFQQGVLKNFWRGNIYAPVFSGWDKPVSWRKGNVHLKNFPPHALRLFHRKGRKV